jgi:hypothetical protein
MRFVPNRVAFYVPLLEHPQDRSYPARGFEPDRFDSLLQRLSWSSSQISDFWFCDAGIWKRRGLSLEPPLELGKNRARATNAKDWECILISRSLTQLRSSTERGKRVIESSRNQENMVGGPKRSSLTLTVTSGHLCLHRSDL